MDALCRWMGGVMLPYAVRVGRRVRLDHLGGTILVARMIGDDMVIRRNTTFGIAGLDAMADRSVIGANAVAVRDVAPGQVVGGVPARPIGRAAP